MTAPAIARPDTLDQIKHLARATAARARCQEQVTRFTVRATQARTAQVRQDWTDLRDEAQRNRDAWDAIRRDLLRQLRSED